MSKKKKHVQSSKEFWEEHKAPADHPIYDGTTKVIFRPKPVKTEEAKLRKLQEFLFCMNLEKWIFPFFPLPLVKVTINMLE